MKTTRYFNEIVLIKRPYIKLEWIDEIISNPLRKEEQSEGRIRYWGYIKEIKKYLRVVTLEDGKTVHNAFPDRDFKEDEK